MIMAIENDTALDGMFEICERIITSASELCDVAVGKEANQEDVPDTFTKFPNFRKLKRTVDSLSQEELKGSIYFLKEGIAWLDSLKLAECSTDHSDLDEYAKSKECFEEAKLAATEVFSDISVKAEVLILAAVIRITARILGCLDNPYVAGVACKLFLQDLHDLTVIQGILKECALKGNDSEEARPLVAMRKSIVLIGDRVRHFVTTSIQSPGTLKSWAKAHNPLEDGGKKSMQELCDKSHHVAKDSTPNKHTTRYIY